jgi:hypothetical protein
MMVVPVRVKAHPNKEIKENLAWCQSEDLWFTSSEAKKRAEMAGNRTAAAAAHSPGAHRRRDCRRRPILYRGLQSIPDRVLQGRLYGMSGAPDGVDGASGLLAIQIEPEGIGEGTGTRAGAFEARTPLSALPERERRKNHDHATRVAAAVPVPVEEKGSGVPHQEVVEGMRALRKRIKPDSISAGGIDRGRRF